MTKLPRPVRTKLRLDKLCLDLQNPRFQEGGAENQAEAIELLCEDEHVYKLAKDIVKMRGINPMSLLGVTPDSSENTDAGSVYTVLDGNRRVCALKLLKYPKLAPTKFQKRFDMLAGKWQPTDEEMVIVFRDRAAAKEWIEREHGGFQDGIGQRAWDYDQTQRFNSNSKYQLTKSILDYAQQSNMIRPSERKAKASTVERYLKNQKLQESIGIDAKDPDNILITRNREDFDKRLKHFIVDLATKKIHSRTGNLKSDVEDYANKLAREIPVQETAESMPLVIKTLTQQTKKALKRSDFRKKPKAKLKKQKINFNQEIEIELEELDSTKLLALYRSICGIGLENNAPILTVGAWSFIETLARLNGCKVGTSFVSFYNRNRLSSLLLSDKNKEPKSEKATIEPVESALKSLSKEGNLTKHDKNWAKFNWQELKTDMLSLEPLIIAICRDIRKNFNQ